MIANEFNLHECNDQTNANWCTNYDLRIKLNYLDFYNFHYLCIYKRKLKKICNSQNVFEIYKIYIIFNKLNIFLSKLHFL